MSAGIKPAPKSPHRHPKTTARQIRFSLLAVVAPERPPCFLNHAAWLEFLAAANEAAITARITPVVQIDSNSGRAYINPKTRFCADCTPDYRAQHQRAGTCRPKWLAELKTKTKTNTMDTTTPTTPTDYTPADGVESEGGSHD